MVAGSQKGRGRNSTENLPAVFPEVSPEVPPRSPRQEPQAVQRKRQAVGSGSGRSRRQEVVRSPVCRPQRGPSCVKLMSSQPSSPGRKVYM